MVDFILGKNEADSWEALTPESELGVFISPRSFIPLSQLYVLFISERVSGIKEKLLKQSNKFLPLLGY